MGAENIKICGVDEQGKRCEGRVRAKGLCPKHYERQRKHGNVYARGHRGKPSRFSTEERVKIFRRIVMGENLSEIARDNGVSRQYIWKLKQRYLKEEEV